MIFSDYFTLKKVLPHQLYIKVAQTFIEHYFFKHVPKNSQTKQFLKFAFQQYQETNRHYHNLDHLIHFIQGTNSFLKSHPNVFTPLEKEQFFVALIGHDLIYNTDKKNDKSNEELSALCTLKILGKDYQLAHDLILCTEHNKTQNLSTEIFKIFVSIDLSILSSSWKNYIQYVKKIEKEYAHIPKLSFVYGRSQFLHHFLQQKQIFPSSYFLEQEQIARKNILKELSIYSSPIEPIVF